MQTEFTVDMHDKDGKRTDKCVMLHVNPTTTLRFENLSELEIFGRRILDQVVPAIRKDHPNA